MPDKDLVCANAQYVKCSMPEVPGCSTASGWIFHSYSHFVMRSIALLQLLIKIINTDTVKKMIVMMMNSDWPVTGK